MAPVDVGLDARSMPWDEQAEKAVLGTLMVWPDRADDVSTLRAGHFFRAAHRLIFDAITKLREQQVVADA